jgi:fatty-acyl-CoA synthase
MHEHWPQKKHAARKTGGIVDGWYHTGDAGSVDEDELLYIRDPLEDTLISGGENDCPAEIENAILAHPSVAEVAVIGVPDQKWGEVELAVIVLKNGGTAKSEDIQATVRQRLAGFKVPSRIEFATALPRNWAGKVTKQPPREGFASA